MVFFPKLDADWLNGWIFLVVYGLVFGVTVRSFPRQTIARLYDRSNWTRTQRILTRAGKVLSSLVFALVAFSPLRIGSPVFAVGGVLYGLGLVGLVIALFDFRAAEPGRPATRGLYRVSRNPQWVMLVTMFVGASLAVGSWAALFFFGAAAVCYHFRILAEERSCLKMYGSAYGDYLERVPRYLLLV
jgi:protein-S-isoprenylcysteine O-methyltransferase Ste14